MTERMRAIEAMLAQEVQRLQEQNSALETVALQLADERDAAMNKVRAVDQGSEGLVCDACWNILLQMPQPKTMALS